MRLVRRASWLIALAFAVPATATAENAWVLWRHFVPADNVEADDVRLWKAEPGAKTKARCESEMKEYRALDPDKRQLDATGRGYRMSTTASPTRWTRAGRAGSEH
jgi:hypothetical protein